MIRYENMELYDKNDKFEHITQQYFQQPTVSIGQLTRKFYFYMLTLAKLHKRHRYYEAKFELKIPSNERYRADVNNACLVTTLLGDNHPLLSISIGPRYPSTYLYPFFRKFWDRDRELNSVPIENSSHEFYTKHGVFHVGKYYLTQRDSHFATLTVERKRPTLKQRWGIWVHGFCGVELPHGELIRYDHTLRDRFTRNRSIMTVVNDVIRRTSGHVYLISLKQGAHNV